MGFESGLDTLPSFDIFHTTLVDLLPLPRNPDNLLNVFLRDADDTIHIGDDVISRVYRHSREAFFGILWADLEGDIYRRWTREGRLTQSRVASRKNRIPKGIVFLDVPTTTGDNHPECFASLCTGRHESAPDRVSRSYKRQLVNSRTLDPKAETELGGALITIIVPAGAVSTKCEESFGALVSEENTICTVYAGPQIV